MNSLNLTIVYTVGHFCIAGFCSMVITGAPIELASIDAIIEPLANAIWLYLLHKLWPTSKLSSKVDLSLD
tara:strand:- start:115 stop:324 length:210 start_codon:yes stop_codon:yes gene_type:complete